MINVSNFTADVRLITTNDSNNKISVTITNGETKVIGLMNGYSYETNDILIEGVSNTQDVKVGDMVYTSGLGGVFPSGILVGTVENITTDSYGLAKIIKVKPLCKHTALLLSAVSDALPDFRTAFCVT